MKREVFLGECGADPPPCYADSAAQDAGQSRLALIRLTSVPAHQRRFSDALATHRAFVRQTLLNPRVRWIRTGADIQSLPSGDTGVLFGMRHAPKRMTKIDMGEWRAARLQFMGLAGAGLEYDRKIVEWMVEYGIMLDLSHADHQATREVLEFVRREDLPLNIVASSSGCERVHAHPRNLPDDILAGITKQAVGYVGIPTANPLLAEEGGDTHSALIRHIAHAMRVCGPDAIGIGSGGNGGGNGLFDALSVCLSEKFSQLAVAGFMGRNFEYFLFRSLPWA